jgi:O-acetyl-ADP-ribose deacetylase (regulator of RNase III)
MCDEIVEKVDQLGEWVEPNTLEEKRALYKCKKYIPVEKFIPWSEAGKKVKSKIDSRYPLELNDPIYKPNDSINKKISLYQGDITALEIDAIVNAASPGLKGGGGMDAAVHSAAGPFLMKECKSFDGCAPGETRLTKGYKLPGKNVLHSVGPLGKESEILTSCYKTSCDLIEKHGLKTVAFSCIGTGAFGFPLPDATKIACATMREWMESHQESVDLIIFCVYSNKELDEYKKNLATYFPL